MRRALITILALLCTKLVFAIDPNCIHQYADGVAFDSWTWSGYYLPTDAARDAFIFEHNVNYNPGFSSNTAVVQLTAGSFTSCQPSVDEVAVTTITYGPTLRQPTPSGAPYIQKADLVALLTGVEWKQGIAAKRTIEDMIMNKYDDLTTAQNLQAAQGINMSKRILPDKSILEHLRRLYITFP